MSIEKSLFQGKLISLGPIDYDNDPAVESRWTHDSDYLRMLDIKPARPLSPTQVKKHYESIEKAIQEEKNQFYFTIRSLSSDEGTSPTPATGLGRLVGFVNLCWIEWNHNTGQIKIAIGSPEDRGHGYGTEALQLILHYAFEEINLYRLMALIPEYNQVGLRFFRKAGFVDEIRRREAVHRDGRRWDLIHLGILQDEWHKPSD